MQAISDIMAPLSPHDALGGLEDSREDLSLVAAAALGARRRRRRRKSRRRRAAAATASSSARRRARGRGRGARARRAEHPVALAVARLAHATRCPDERPAGFAAYEGGACELSQQRASERAPSWAGGFNNVRECKFLRLPGGPLIDALMFLSGQELARLEVACATLARARACEAAAFEAARERLSEFDDGHDAAGGGGADERESLAVAPPGGCLL